MIASSLYGVLLLVSVMLQSTLISSWPEPFRLFPLTLIVGIIILHERSVLYGSVWLVVASFMLEWRGLGDGYTVAGLAASLTGAILVWSVLAKRSAWALLGVAGGCATMFVLTRLLWLGLLTLITDRPLQLPSLLESGAWTLIMTCLGGFVFGVYLRRFFRWSKTRFLSKSRLYEISLPN